MRINVNSTVYNTREIKNTSQFNKKIDKVDSIGNEDKSKKRQIIFPNLIDKNVQPYSTIYNNANLQCNLTSKDSEDKESDEELNLEVDKKIYEKNHLKDNGIEFNSPEFKAWMQQHKEYSVIPVDAPGEIRKRLMDMMDAVPNDNIGLKCDLADQIQNMFSHKNINNSSDITKSCENVIQENSDYIDIVKMCGSNSELDQNAINRSNNVIDFFRQFENFIKLKYE